MLTTNENIYKTLEITWKWYIMGHTQIFGGKVIVKWSVVTMCMAFAFAGCSTFVSLLPK